MYNYLTKSLRIIYRYPYNGQWYVADLPDVSRSTKLINRGDQ